MRSVNIKLIFGIVVLAVLVYMGYIVLINNTDTEMGPDNAHGVYRNEEYGFEFTYPKDRFALDDMSRFSSDNIVVSLYDIQGKKASEECQCGRYARFQVYVDQNGGLTLDEYALKNYDQDLLYGYEDIVIDGHKAVIFGEMTRYILVNNNDLVFIMRPIGEIVSNFRFLE